MLFRSPSYSSMAQGNADPGKKNKQEISIFLFDESGHEREARSHGKIPGHTVNARESFPECRNPEEYQVLEYDCYHLT